MIAKFEGQKEWGWNVAFYLFLAGMGAGAYATGAVAGLVGGEDWVLISKIGVVLGFPLVFIGTFFLIADLGVKWRALYVFLNPGTSWIARGTFIISIFMILGAIHIAFWIWPFTWLENLDQLRNALGIVNFVFAILTMIYTGILLGASRPIALWSTPLLPLLFLISAGSTGIMAVGLATSIYAYNIGEFIERELILLIKFDILLIIIEFIVLAFYLQAMHRTVESRASAGLLVNGKLALEFWAGLIGFGLFIPLFIELVEMIFFKGAFLEEMLFTLVISQILGLIGGLLLRHLVLSAGVRAPLRAGSFEFTHPR